MCCIVPNKLYLCVIKVGKNKKIKKYSHESIINQIRTVRTINPGRINNSSKRNISSGQHAEPAQNFQRRRIMEYPAPDKIQGSKKIYLICLTPLLDGATSIAMKFFKIITP